MWVFLLSSQMMQRLSSESSSPKSLITDERSLDWFLDFSELLELEGDSLSRTDERIDDRSDFLFCLLLLELLETRGFPRCTLGLALGDFDRGDLGFSWIDLRDSSMATRT